MKLTIKCGAPHPPAKSIQRTIGALSLSRSRPHDKIGLLKYQIDDRAGIPIHEQRLVLGSPDQVVPPNDEQSLEGCGLHDGDVVTVHRIPSASENFSMDEPFKIVRAILSTEKVFLLEVCRSDTFGAMKRKIERAEGYAVGEQHFAWEDEQMLDGVPRRLDEVYYGDVEVVAWT
ncbi:MAG: hypothetical protein ALECFALPRED_007457 [Alectoria fallacina]|uniref:Ubiquitin-like domain-containing protein n=1 Tax=Alectoria fallacina TaxID=1903189 RepID=A0A8H3G873_9LECA|nr:MAG: hypothetical protein ALECFALPRED_007457 [Alectoria fallacina]